MEIKINTILIEDLERDYPLIHKAGLILSQEGRGAFDRWASELPEEERGKVAAQVIDLLAEVVGMSPETIARAILTGKLRL